VVTRFLVIIMIATSLADGSLAGLCDPNWKRQLQDASKQGLEARRGLVDPSARFIIPVAEYRCLEELTGIPEDILNEIFSGLALPGSDQDGLCDTYQAMETLPWGD
tara:strand:- start:5751 stop:6068 length:318 start_codon:yes stop_codon:yes gene_type:complete